MWEVFGIWWPNRQLLNGKEFRPLLSCLDPQFGNRYYSVATERLWVFSSFTAF